MKRRLFSVTLVSALCAGLGLVAFLPGPEVRSQVQPDNAGALSTDQRLNQILGRLDRIERRLDALSKVPGTTARPLPRTAPAARAALAAPVQPPAIVLAQLPADVADRQQPHSSTYEGCDPRGSGGDEDLSFLKNRIDQPDHWFEVSFDAVLNQAFPVATIGRVDRARWAPADTKAVQRFEGLPLAVICYFAWAQDEGPESCNCHAQDPAMYDIHTWLTKEPAQISGSHAPNRQNAVVAEVTPRMKHDHPQWTQNNIRQLARDGRQVRISGWLLMDQEHPDQLKPTGSHPATRGTLWEIHPIIAIDVMENGQWLPLDDL
jgi:hypothetical protein